MRLKNVTLLGPDSRFGYKLLEIRRNNWLSTVVQF